MTSLVSMSRTQLAAELDRIHLAGAVNGPLAGFLAGAKAKKADSIAPLQWPEEIAPETALRAIAFQPLGHVETYSADTLEQHLILDIPAPDQFAMLSMAADRATLTYGLSAQTFAAIFGEVIGAVEAAPPLPFRGDFGRDAAIAFCAMVDWVRLMTAASLVERKGLETLAARPADLCDLWDRGRSDADYRWLSALLSRIANVEAADPRRMIADGVEALEASELVTIARQDQEMIVRPRAALVTIALDLIVPLPAIALRARTGEGKAVLIKGKSVWLIERKGEGFVIEGLDGLAALTLIGAAFSPKALAWSPADGSRI